MEIILVSGTRLKKVLLDGSKTVRFLKLGNEYVQDFLVTLEIFYLPSWANQIELVTLSIHSDGSGSKSTMSTIKNGSDIIDITYEYPYILIKNKLEFLIIVQTYIDNNHFDGRVI
jgi:hypothetical protein